MDTSLITYDQLSQDYVRIEQAIRYLEENFRRQPSLGEISAHIGFSEYHFQRLFTHWVGISPKRFLQFLTKEYVAGLLQESHNILEATYESGFSSPGRLHDLMVSCEAVTPGEYKNQGEGLRIEYGFHPTPFGKCLLASTPRGICSLRFVGMGGEAAALADLKTHWRRAIFVENLAGTKKLAEAAFAGMQREPLPIFLHGTNFQIKVWEALLRIPSGTVVTYQDIALSIGLPRASRAVGNAVGSNPLAVIIPCHRVIRKNGWFGNYLYGTPRKMALFGWERAQKELAGGAVSGL
jgi:AraC family transcriptional regulator of adaptative response/methylated-DNA-[protein]-cysteine methyltransferase